VLQKNSKSTISGTCTVPDTVTDIVMDMNSDIYISSLDGIVEARKFWDLAVAFLKKRKAESVS
jgi:hypothetical protein